MPIKKPELQNLKAVPISLNKDGRISAFADPQFALELPLQDTDKLLEWREYNNKRGFIIQMRLLLA